MRRASVVLSVVGAAVLALVASPGDVPSPAQATVTVAVARPHDHRPNILLITSDDQTDVEMAWMPRTQRLIAGAGVRVADFISPHPLCCPARAEILTGEYAQNNGVRHNNGPYGGWARFLDAGNARHQLGVWLHRAGYQTGFVGKTLNHFPQRPRSLPGFDHWNPISGGTYDYYGSEFYNDGRPLRYPDDYVADVIADYTHRYVKEFSHERRPWFLWVSHVGPHVTHVPGQHEVPPIPAARHADLFRAAQPPSTAKASYNEADTSDKPSTIRHDGYVDDAYITKLFRARIRTLQSIDEANARVIRQLRRSGELANTLVVYLSDNGYLLGEHRLTNKNLPYEEAMQVPLLLRGPGLSRGARVSGQRISMVDLAPTLLARARTLETVRASGSTDGIDVWPVLQGRRNVPDTQLIQAGTASGKALDKYGWYWRGVTTARWTYAHWWTGEDELYDRQADPLELNNLASTASCSALLAQLRERLEALRKCDGHAQCRRDFGVLDDSASCSWPNSPRSGR